MKVRKIWCWSVVVLAVVVASIVTWVCWPEYGKGYSEDQRRNWNALVEATGDDGKAYSKALNQPWGCSFFSMMKDRQSQPDAPVRKLEIPETDPFSLPLEGMSVPVLRHLADKGNGKACLELVFRSFDNSFWNDKDDFSFPDFSAVYQVERYLKKATETGLPGADFLLRLFEYRKRNGDDLHVRDLEGYEDFLVLLDQGDFLLGKVYLHLDPKGNIPLSRLEKGLNTKVGDGNREALRNAGHFALLRQYRGQISSPSGMIYALYDRMGMEQASLYLYVNESMKWFKKVVPSLADQSEKMRMSLIEWLEGRGWRSIRRDLQEPVDMLGEAAKQGDLHAKYLWCEYLVVTQRIFSREDWERYLVYVDELFKIGGIYRGGNSIDFNPYIYPVGLYFYQPKTTWEMINVLKKVALRELSPLCSKFADSQEKKEMELFSIGSMEFFSNHYYHFYSGKEREYRRRLVERAAAEGDPYAMYYFSMILNEGTDGVIDSRRSWDFLQRLKAWREGIHGRISHEYMGMDTEIDGDGKVFSYRSFSDSVDILELDIISRHGDMPGMTVKEAFEKFVSISSGKNHSYSSFNRERQPARVKEQFEKRGFKVPDEKK